MTRVLVFTVFSLMTATCLADPPASSYVFPAGGQRGATVQCRVGGMNLSAECGFRVLGTGVEAPAKIASMPTLVLVGPYHHNPVAQQAWDYPKDMAAQFKIASDSTLGVRYWYCTTAEGATQLRPFVVGDLPEVIEDEEKTTLGRPQQVALPVTINGRIYPRADLDEFLFDAKAGEHLSCEVMSQRLGHKLDAKLELRDAAGKLIADGDDGHGRDSLLLVTIPADGRYVLRIHDIAFEGDQDYVYRLSLRTGPYVTHVFPAGGRRGSSPTVRIYGFGLGHDGFREQRLALASDMLGVSDRPPVANGLRAVPSSVMSSLMLAGSAAQASSPTPASNDGRGTLPSAFPINAFVSSGFQISDFSELIEAEPNDHSERAQRVESPAVINGQILAAGDVDEFVFAATKGQKIDFDFFGRRLGSPITGVCLILDSQGKQLARQEGDTRLAFVSPADGDFTIRVHELHRETHGGSEFIYRLVACAPQPDFRLALEKDNIGVLPGQPAKMKLNVVRSGGFTGDVQFAASELPVGVTIAPTTIAANQNQIELTFTAAKDAPVGDTRRAVIIGTATAAETRLLRSAEVPPVPGAIGQPGLDSVAVTVTHPPLFAIDTEEVYLNANRGATFVQRFTIERQPGFDGEIALSIADRQTRYLQGATGPTVIVKPGEKEMDYPVFFPEEMDLNRTARVLVMGTAKITDSAGKVQYVSSTTKKQIVVRVSPSLLTISADRDLIEATPGQTIQVPLRVGRTPELVGAVIVEAVVPSGMKGITASTATMSDEQDLVTVSVQLAADAQRIGNHDRLQFRATGQHGGHPVIAETEVELLLLP
jgi:hypothetical protein